MAEIRERKNIFKMRSYNNICIREFKKRVKDKRYQKKENKKKKKIITCLVKE